MISVIATLADDTKITASRGYPAGGGDDVVTLSIDSPHIGGVPNPAVFTVDEFREFVRVLGFTT